MADKRLDQENVLTDFDYALIVKGTDVAKISKADLASVVGGRLGIEIISAYGETINLALSQANKNYYVSAICLSNFNLSGYYNVVHNGHNQITSYAIKEAANFSFEKAVVKYSGGNGPYLVTAVCFG